MLKRRGAIVLLNILIFSLLLGCYYTNVSKDLESASSDVVSYVNTREHYQSVLNQISYNVDDYNFNKTELTLLTKMKEEQQIINVPYVPGFKTPSYYNESISDLKSVHYDEDKSGFLGTQFLLADVLERMFDIKSEYVAYESESDLHNALINNTPHPFNGLASAYSTSIIRTNQMEDNLYLYEDNTYTPQLYAFTNVNSLNYPKDFDLQQYLFQHYDPIVAYVGNEIYRPMIEYKIPNARFFVCRTFEFAIQLEKNLNFPLGCSHSPSQYNAGFEAAATYGQPVIIIGEITGFNNYPTGSNILLDYQIINSMFQLASGTVGGNKTYDKTGFITNNNEAQLLVDILGKIISKNKQVFQDYRSYLYEIVDIKNVEMNYESTLHELAKRPTRVGFYLDKQGSGWSFDDLQKYLIVMLDNIYKKYTYKGVPIEYEPVIYNNASELLQALVTGEVDVLGDFSAELKTNPFFDSLVYSRPIQRFKYALVSTNSNQKIYDISSVYSNTVGYSFFSLQHIEESRNDVEQFLKMHKTTALEKAVNKPQMMLELASGKYDYALIDLEFLERYQNGMKNYDINIVYEFEAEYTKSFAFSTAEATFLDDFGTPILQNFFNSALGKMNLQRIIIENSPEPISISSLLKQNEQLIIFLQALIIFIVVLLLLALVIMMAGFTHSNRNLRREARYDFLTGCKTRRALFDEYLAFNKGSFLYIDVDDFKDVNDRFGHDAGDKALKFISSTLGKHFGKEHCFRIGGDEFVVMSPQTNLISKIDLLMTDLSKGIEVESARIATNLSLGYAEDIFSKISKKPHIEQTLRFLDKALFEAKAKHEDPIVMVEPEDIVEYFNLKS